MRVTKLVIMQSSPTSCHFQISSDTFYPAFSH